MNKYVKPSAERLGGYAEQSALAKSTHIGEARMYYSTWCKGNTEGSRLFKFLEKNTPDKYRSVEML